MSMIPLRAERSMKATYIPIHANFFRGTPKQGNFPLTIDEKQIGTIDISTFQDKTHVSVQLVDTFLNLDQLQLLISQLQTDFCLSPTQKVSFEQI